AISGLGIVFVGDDRGRSWVRWVARLLYGLALGHDNSCAIFQNPDDLRDMVEAGLVPRDRTVLIRSSGVDVSVFRPSPPPPGPPVVIMPARLLWPKGVGEFVEAARLLREAGVPVRMVLVGRPVCHHPSSVAQSDIESWVEQGLIEWWGHCPDMVRVYESCHVVCLPSYYGEGVPRVLIEAAACGRPVVTTDFRGCREAVKHGDNGLLVPPRSP